ncbi:MAG: threonine/serine exporter family protein [Terrisporobacter sp.]|uniref:threonine/serine exporter family protein n=1 Tax=Terrisporobacter sp. TaxID=1965305 RepID=UPI002FC684EF
MNIEISSNNKKNILRLALFIGELMLTNGAETYRVEDTVIRICKSRGFNHINVFTSPTVIIISDYRFDGYSFMKTIKSRSINLDKISALNNFSRQFVGDNEITVENAMKELKSIVHTSSYSKITQYISTGIGSAFFAGLVEGNNIPTFVTTFITSILAVKIYNKIIEMSSIPAFASLISSSFIAAMGVILTQLNVLAAPTMLVVGSIMPLLPGVSFIKGLRDLIAGDLIAGVARAFDAGVTAVSIACGVGMVLDVWFMLGGVL